MTVGEMLTRISSYEITEWMAFYRIEATQADEQEKR